MRSPVARAMQALRPCETQPAGFGTTSSASPDASAARVKTSTEPSVEPPSATNTSTSPAKSWLARSDTRPSTCAASFSIGTRTVIRCTGVTPRLERRERPALGVAVLGPRLDRLLVVVRPADVEPHAAEAVGADGKLSREKRLDEVREVVLLALGNELENLRLHHVDAHAHRRHDLGLLFEGMESRSNIEVKHSVVDSDRPIVRRDRQHVSLLTVVLQELSIIGRRQDVAVHAHEGPVEAVDEPQRRRRP